MNSFSVLIPARMHSTRLPHKMTLNLGGVPLIIRTAKQASKSSASKVIVATDHPDIVTICKEHDIDVVLTQEKHKTGTDRLSEVATLLNLADNEIVVNVQGDEPLIDPQLINQLAEFIVHQQTEIATIAHPIYQEDEIFNPHIVKVVLDKLNNALYFSRAPIPFYRDGFMDRTQFKLPQNLNLLRHIGIYAYTAKFLKTYTQMADCALEHTECLEQLRALYNGHKIAVLTTPLTPVAGVDTLEDLQRIRQVVSKL